MGTPSFAIPALKLIFENGYEPIAVYTQPDRINGRGKKINFSPVKTFALEKNIPVYQPLCFGEEELTQLKNLQPDLLIVIAYGKILPKAVLDIPAYGAINVHASLLPQYRGAAPIQRAIIDGKTETGVTIMKLDVGMDTGDMLIQKKVQITPHMTAGELFDLLSKQGAQLLVKILSNLPYYLKNAIPQIEENATYAEKITKSMGKISWDQEAQVLDSLCRGIYPSPGAYVFFRGKRVKIHKTTYEPNDKKNVMPGTIVSLENQVISVQTKNGLLKIIEIQPENHKKMSAADFINGYQVKINDQLE